LLLHILFGFYAYAALSRQLLRIHALENTNRQLSENNQRIYQLSEAFKNLSDTDEKIKAALGLSKAPLEASGFESTENATHSISDSRRWEKGTLAVTQAPASAEISVSEKLGMLQEGAQSGLHEYLREIPTYLPVQGVLTNDYAAEESDRVTTGHQGVDIAAARGSFVRAAGDGVVIFAGWTEDLGNLMILYHGNGFFTYYGHNQHLLFRRNELVRKADVIATVGSSGASSAPHLHFEIWKDGVPQDPKKYILAFSRM